MYTWTFHNKLQNWEDMIDRCRSWWQKRYSLPNCNPWIQTNWKMETLFLIEINSHTHVYGEFFLGHWVHSLWLTFLPGWYGMQSCHDHQRSLHREIDCNNNNQHHCRVVSISLSLVITSTSNEKLKWIPCKTESILIWWPTL